MKTKITILVIMVILLTSRAPETATQESEVINDVVTDAPVTEISMTEEPVVTEAPIAIEPPTEAPTR